MKNNTKLDRAKIFLPFDALKGLREALREKERILVDKKILSIEEKEKISKKLIQIKKGMIIKVVYFENNEYIELEGMVSNIDFVYKKLIIVKKEIYFTDILKITSIDIKEEDIYQYHYILHLTLLYPHYVFL